MPKKFIQDKNEFEMLVTSGADFYELQKKYGFAHVDNIYYWCYKWNISIPNKRGKPGLASLSMSNEQHQIVIGSILGDGYLQKFDGSRNSCLVITHGHKQKEYLEWKLDKLGEFRSGNLYEYTQKQGGFSNKPRYTGRTVRHPIFSEYRTLSYPNGVKTITQELLNKLNFLGLAVWVMDDGWYSWSIGLSTNSFSYDEHLIMQKHFNDWLGLDVRIHTKQTGRQKGQHTLQFTKSSSDLLAVMLKPYIFPPFLYKIGF